MYLILIKYIGDDLYFNDESIGIFIHYKILFDVTYNTFNQYAYVGSSKVINLDNGDGRTSLLDRIYIFIFICLIHIHKTQPIQLIPGTFRS